LGSVIFWGFLDETGLTGLPNQRDWFPLVSEELSLGEPFLPDLKTDLTGLFPSGGARVVFRCIF
jgi:hypothetical protein